MTVTHPEELLDQEYLAYLRSSFEEKRAQVRTCPSTKVPIELAYHTFGPAPTLDAPRPTILLVMGLNSQSVAWDAAFCEKFVQQGYFVIRYDNRDCGLSTKLDQCGSISLFRMFLPAALSIGERLPYTLLDMAMDGIALLDFLKIPAAHVVGVSMGGMLAQLMAIHAPQRVLSLTSIMSHTAGPRTVHPTIATKRLFLKKPKSLSCEHLAEFGYERIMTVGGIVNFDPKRIYTIAFLGASRTTYRLGLGRQGAAILRAPSREQGLSELTIPALVIHGTHDPLIPVQNAYHTVAALQRRRQQQPTGSSSPVELMILPGRGHYISPPDYDQYVEAIHRIAQAGEAKRKQNE